MPEHDVESSQIVALTRTHRIEDTIPHGKRSNTQGGTMPQAELLELVKARRDERGRMQDTAAYLLLMEVAWCLELDTAAARSDLLQRVNAFRVEGGGAHDTALLLLLTEVAAALHAVDARQAAPMEWTIEEILAREG